MYSLTLQNAAGDSVITSGDILGRINFAVPAESDGFSATYVSSFINCSAEGVFSSGSNPAGLIFGVSSADPDAATGVLKISSDGNFLPLVSGIYNIGDPSYQFKNVYSNTGTFYQIDFNTSLADPTLTAGQLQWNSTEGTLDLGLNDSYAMHLGEEMLYRVRNITGSTLLAGQPVYASGLSAGANNRIEVNLYVADGTIREVRFMGLITEDLPDAGNNGFATHFGYIRKIDTRGDAATYGTINKLWASGEPAWNEGDILYVHPTVAGKLTKIEPKHSISVAIITNKGSNGKLFVRPTSYGHLDDNHDVAVSGATNGQFLQYNSATDYWVPSSSGNFTTLEVNGTPVPTGVGTTNYVTKWTGANSIGSGIIYDDGTNVGIGTSSPNVKLDVVGSGAFTGNVSVGGKITHPSLTGVNDFIIYSQGDETLISAKAGHVVRIRAGGNDASYETMVSSSYMYIGGNRIRLNSAETTINEFGFNVDFRVEGDADANLLFVDASTDRVGIGTSSPSYKLEVSGTAGFSSTIDAGNIGTGEDNSVVVLDSDGKLRTDEIDSRVWGSSLVDGNGTANYIAKWSDSDTLTSGIIYDNGTNVGIGVSSPVEKLYVGGSIGNLGWRINEGYGNTIGPGIASGVAITLNNQFGTTLTTTLQYKVRLTTNGTATQTGATYLVRYNTSTSAWVLREVGLEGNTSNHPLLAESGGQLIAYTNHPAGYGIRYLVESYNTDDADSTPNSMGADYHWQRLGNNLYYIDGNVSIGTTTASNRLNVEGGNIVFNDLGGNYDFRVEGDADANLFFTDASLDYVGIGTSSPLAKLNVLGTKDVNYGTVIIQDSTSIAVGVGGDILFGGKYTTAGDYARYGRIGAIKENNIDGNSQSAMIFHTNAGASLAERVRINSSGNVGIGTQTPTAKLHVAGSTTLEGLVRWEYPEKAFDPSIGSLGYLRTYDETGAYAGLGISTSSFNIGTSGAINFRTVTNGIERTRIDTNGNFIFNEDGNNCDFRIEGDTDPSLFFSDASTDRIGIGTNTPSGKLHINSSAANTLRLESTAASASFIIKHALASQWGFIEFNNNSANRAFLQHNGTTTTAFGGPNALSMYNYAGPLSFGTNTTTSFIERMAIDVSGNITINDGGLNSDFRIEGDTNANLLFTDASVDRVGIGTSAPLDIFSVEPTNATTDLNGMSIRRNGSWGGSYANKYLSYVWRDNTAVVAAIGASYDGTSVNIDFHSMYNAAHKTSADVVMSIHGDGNIGIGTKTPSARLNVESGNIIFNDLGGDYDFRVEGDTDANLLFTDASTDRVGIGTSAPISKFMVASTGDPTIVIGTNSNISSSICSLNFQDRVNALNQGSSGQITSYIRSERVGPNAEYNLTFGTVNATSGNAVERMRITNSGNVGIGTATPTRQLHTAGSTALIADGSNYELDISASAATFGGNRLQLLGTETVFNQAGENYDFRVEGDTDENLISVDASTDRVGIGVLVPQAKLDVNGTFKADNVVTLGSGSVPLPRKPIELLNPTNIAELSINEVYTFPTIVGASGTTLIGNGAGGVSWTTVGTSGVANNAITYDKLSNSATEGDNVQKRVAKAWVNFNGTGTVAIRDDFNVTSITDGGVGVYTINFTSALASSNYCFVGFGRDPNDDATITNLCSAMANDTKTTGALTVRGSYVGVYYDIPEMNVIVFL